MMRNSDRRWLEKTIIPELLRITDLLEEIGNTNTAVLLLAVVDEIAYRTQDNG